MKNRFFTILSIFCLILSGCGKSNGVPQNFKPASMSLDGKYDAVFNEDYAADFQKKVLDTMQPTEMQEVGEDYCFTLLEEPGEVRREYRCAVSTAQKLLKSEAGCFRLTDDAVSFLRELTDFSAWITEGKDYTLPKDTYMTVTAIYEDFFFAVLSEDPSVKVKVTPYSGEIDKTVGDKVTGSFYDTKKKGDRIETRGASLMTQEEKENEKPIIA